MNRIKHFRVKAGMSQAQLSVSCGWTKETEKYNGRISNYETGVRMPTLSDCRLIVSRLNQAGVACTIDDVFPAEETVAA